MLPGEAPAGHESDFLFECLKPLFGTPARDYSMGSCFVPFQTVVWCFSALSDELVAAKPLLRDGYFPRWCGSLVVLVVFSEYLYWLSNLLLTSRILYHMPIDAVSEVWWLHLFLKKLGAPPVLVWSCWDGMASAGEVGSAVSYQLYPWTGIEELGFRFGSAPDFSGWLCWCQFLSLWFNF